MKFHIFLTLAIIFFATTLVPATEGTHAKVKEYMSGGECMIWVTDVNGKYVAGDKKFHSCDDRTTLDIDTKSNDAYFLLATTVGELETARRGPFEGDTCFIIEGFI
ncbi:16137_t:CDS:2 [Rhizophagus irregularis]|nr:16137_t:CDS:2 [Rhizophagus irregularis]